VKNSGVQLTVRGMAIKLRDNFIAIISVNLQFNERVAIKITPH
jgi:hypothetical protein